MEEQITIFEVMRTILLWLTPLAFLAGIFLLTGKVDKCIKLEQFLDKEVGIKKRLIPKIETNIYSFQNWLVKKTGYAWFISYCLFYSVIHCFKKVVLKNFLAFLT